MSKENTDTAHAPVSAPTATPTCWSKFTSCLSRTAAVAAPAIEAGTKVGMQIGADAAAAAIAKDKNLSPEAKAALTALTNAGINSAKALLDRGLEAAKKEAGELSDAELKAQEGIRSGVTIAATVTTGEAKKVLSDIAAAMPPGGSAVGAGPSDIMVLVSGSGAGSEPVPELPAAATLVNGKAKTEGFESDIQELLAIQALVALGLDNDFTNFNPSQTVAIIKDHNALELYLHSNDIAHDPLMLTGEVAAAEA